MDDQNDQAPDSHRSGWRAPTISEIARRAGLSTATVDRVLNNRSGVREKTRVKVQAATSQLLRQSNTSEFRKLRIGLVVESGESFNRTLEAGVRQFNAANQDVEILGKYFISTALESAFVVNQISKMAENTDCLILVSRENAEINRAVKDVVRQEKPIICLTSDLPRSGRASYVGNDQTAAGETAGFLIGRSVRQQSGRVLFVLSVAFRCQQEREQGFRNVLRTEFPDLVIDERISAAEDFATAHDELSRYVSENGPPAAIYNVSGANMGIASALVKHGLERQVLFVGHELNENSRGLMEKGIMDFAIGHNVGHEIRLCVAEARRLLASGGSMNRYTEIQVFTPYNCTT